MKGEDATEEPAERREQILLLEHERGKKNTIRCLETFVGEVLITETNY